MRGTAYNDGRGEGYLPKGNISLSKSFVGARTGGITVHSQLERPEEQSQKSYKLSKVGLPNQL